MISDDLLNELGPDLRALVCGLTPPPVEAQRLSGLDAPRHPASAYRLDFADGRTLKARRLRDPAAAERVEYVLQSAGHPALPKLLARRGCAVLLEWVAGRPLGSASERQVRACATLQAELHRTPLPPACPHTPADAIAAQASRTLRHLRQLSDAGVLEARRADDLRARLAAHRPPHAAACVVGFVHGDICPENIVTDAGGALRLIDNEGVSVGPCDGDLGRTWLRWPMPPSQREVYLEAYAAKQPVDAFLAHFAWWALVCTLGSAAYRIGAASAILGVPMQRLAALEKALERGSAPIRLYLEC